MDGICKDFAPGDCDVTAKNDNIKTMAGKKVQVRVCQLKLNYMGSCENGNENRGVFKSKVFCSRQLLLFDMLTN